MVIFSLLETVNTHKLTRNNYCISKLFSFYEITTTTKKKKEKTSTKFNIFNTNNN